MPGTLFVVATPIGNLEDVTARALRVLREATMIAAEDTRRTARLLSRYAITTPTTSLHEHNEAHKATWLVARLERGDSVALVSDAGTPTISDPGLRMIRATIEAGIRIESIPGPNAAIAALAASGFMADSFAFMGFPPSRSQARSGWLNRAAAVGGTVVFYEAPHRIRQTLRDLQRAVGDCPILVARELTKAHEELIRGPISVVLPRLATPIGEFTVIAMIGQPAKNSVSQTPDPGALLIALGDMTDAGGMTRRAAVTALARQHGIRPNLVYQMLEIARKSG